MYCPTNSPLPLDRQWAQMAGFDMKHVSPIFVSPSLLLMCSPSCGSLLTAAWLWPCLPMTHSRALNAGLNT